MRLFLSLSAAVVLGIVILAACNSNEGKNNVAGNSGKPVTISTPITPPSDGVRRITTVELRDAIDKGAAIIVDVRPAVSYQQSHIKGAIHIPLEEVASRLGELPRDKMIVTYCS